MPSLRGLNAVLAGLLALSILFIQCATGGTRLVFALPAYGLLAIAGVLSIREWRRESARPSSACLAITTLFFAYILARAACSPWDYLWWQDFYQVLGCLIVYGLCTCYLTSLSPRMAIIIALLVLSVGEFFVGLRQFRYGDNWMPFGFLRPDSGLRASGTLISSIHFGGFMEATGAFALALACWSRWNAGLRFAAGYAAVMCYGGVAISGSRGAWVSTLVSLAAFGVLSLYAVRKARPNWLAWVLTVGSMVGALFIAGGIALMARSPLLQQRIDALKKQDIRVMSLLLSDGTREGTVQPNTDVRIYNWRAALDHFRVSPVFGTGAGTHLYYGRLFRRPEIQSDPIHAHSDYLELLAEYGIVGACGMGLFLLLHIGHGLRRYAHVLRTEMRDLGEYETARNDEMALLIGALSAVAAYLAHSVVDFNLHIPGNALMFAVIFAILAAPAPGGRPSRTFPEMAWRVAVPALGIWMAVAVVRLFPGEYWCEKARVALRDRRLTEAIELAQRAVRHEERNWELWFHLGEAWRLRARGAVLAPDRENQHLQALAAYDRALGIFPVDEHVLIRKAQVLDELGRFAEARATYQQVLQHDPQLGVIHAYYAQHLFRVGRHEEAREEFQKARKLGATNLSRVVDQSFIDAPVEPPLP